MILENKEFKEVVGINKFDFLCPCCGTQWLGDEMPCPNCNSNLIYPWGGAEAYLKSKGEI